MQRKRRLDLETLESRALLSGLSFSLTTNQAAYKVGQAIQMTFTETNTSNQSLTVPVKPVDFTVAQNNALIWQSNPGNQTLPPTIETLKPGQSVTQTATWDGMTGGLTAPVSGPPVSAGVNHWGDFVVSNPNVPPGQNLTASFQISDPISQTLTTSQSVYQVGQTVQMTYTETNTANQSITFANPGPAGFTIMHDGKAVLIPILPTTYSLPTITLKAGQTITDTQTWNGTSTVAGSGILTGTFTAEFGPSLQPNMLTTNFQIAPPPQAVNLVTSITTDHSVYTLGQPVNITFTETNQGDQPVSIESGPPAIQITQNGKVVWDDDYTGTRTTETLQPGQSITQTAVWSESAITTTNAAPTIGTFVVTNTLDPNDSTATFQIIGPPNPSPPNPNPVPPSPPGFINPPPGTMPPTFIKPTVTTTLPVYNSGQKVRITMTLTDVSKKKVLLSRHPGVDGFSIWQGSTEVFSSTRANSAFKVRTIKPGQTVKLTTVWNGLPNQPGVTALSAGTYTIEAVEGGYVGTSTVTIK